MDKQTSKASQKKNKKPDAVKLELEGEGSYRATRTYDKAARDFVRSGQVGPAADDAKRAVDADEKSMKNAEEIAKRGPEKLH